MGMPGVECIYAGHLLSYRQFLPGGLVGARFLTIASEPRYKD